MKPLLPALKSVLAVWGLLKKPEIFNLLVENLRFLGKQKSLLVHVAVSFFKVTPKG